MFKLCSVYYCVAIICIMAKKGEGRTFIKQQKQQQLVSHTCSICMTMCICMKWKNLYGKKLGFHCQAGHFQLSYMYYCTHGKTFRFPMSIYFSSYTFKSKYVNTRQLRISVDLLGHATRVDGGEWSADDLSMRVHGFRRGVVG